jgi:hypothetical protein
VENHASVISVSIAERGCVTVSRCVQGLGGYYIILNFIIIIIYYLVLYHDIILLFSSKYIDSPLYSLYSRYICNTTYYIYYTVQFSPDPNSVAPWKKDTQLAMPLVMSPPITLMLEACNLSISGDHLGTLGTLAALPTLECLNFE